MSIDLFNLIRITDKLKHLKRTGWIRHGIPEPETVASHMYRMSILAMTLAVERKDLDIWKCVRMALVHDIGEAIIGDLTPQCGVDKHVKFEIEQKAVKEICTFVPVTIGTDWDELWLEYETGSTPEAIAVKQLDKFDMLAQAVNYEERYGMDLTEFVKSTEDSFNEQPFIGWAEQVRDARLGKTKN